VSTGKGCDAVCADFVGRVTIGRDAIGARDYGLDAALAHDLGCDRIADQRAIDATLHELPHREPGALQQRTGFI